MEIFVPGRLCLMGEHSDWAGAWRATHPETHVGQCLVSGTRQGIRAEAEALSEPAFAMSVPSEDGREELRVAFSELGRLAREGGFFSYAAGVTAELVEQHQPTGGLSLRVTAADLPVRKGLSSSAAACVLVARAFNRVHGLGLEVEQEMELAYRGELRAGSGCGRMDQVCALGQRTSLLTFDGDELRVEPVVPGAEMHLLIVDLRAGKDTRQILSDLQACFPDAPGQLAANVREALGPRNATLLAHARRLLEAGDARALGELLTEAQAVFDEKVAPASSELAAPRLHAVLESSEARELAWGGKGVGSQGDGCAQLLARGPAEARQLAKRLEDRFAVSCLDLVLAAERG